MKTGKAGSLRICRPHPRDSRPGDLGPSWSYRAGKADILPAHSRSPTDSLEVLTPPDYRRDPQGYRRRCERRCSTWTSIPRMMFAADGTRRRRPARCELQLAVTMEGATRRIPVTADLKVEPRQASAASGNLHRRSRPTSGSSPTSGGPGGTVKVADQRHVLLRPGGNPRRGCCGQRGCARGSGQGAGLRG